MGDQLAEPVRPSPTRQNRQEASNASASSPLPVSPRSTPSASSRLKDEMAATFSNLSSEAYCALDAQLNCVHLSDNWKLFSGFEAEDDMGDGLRSRIAPDHLHKLAAYLTSERRNSALRFQIKHSDGSWHWCELQLGSSDGSLFNCLLRDVTEWVSMQSVLERTKLEAELANKSRSEFLANMSHELRTPLNAILGFAQMIEAGTYGSIGHPKYNDYIGSIQESGSTLLSKVNDLLEIANIDAGRMTLNESSVDVGQAIRQAIEFHSHRAFCLQVTLRPHLPEQPVLVRADRIRLLQVLTNLIANAINHSHEGGSVDVYCSVRSDSGVSIAVRDTGEGIAPAHLESILAAFKQEDSFFARTRDCVGLGLALSKEIVKLHDGRIDIESTVGEGTLINIRLPRERTVSKQAARKKPKAPESGKQSELN